MNSKGVIYPIRWYELMGGLAIAATVLIYAVHAITDYSPAPTGYSCYTEQAILLNQYLDNFSGCQTQPCLFMDVYTEYATFLPCGHLEKIEWRNRTYYFANEGLRPDLQANDSIEVTWCYNSDVGQRLIREVRKR